MFKKCTEVGHKIDKLIKRSVCVAAQYKVALILISEKIGNHVSFVFFCDCLKNKITIDFGGDLTITNNGINLCFRGYPSLSYLTK